MVFKMRYTNIHKTHKVREPIGVPFWMLLNNYLAFGFFGSKFGLGSRKVEVLNQILLVEKYFLGDENFLHKGKSKKKSLPCLSWRT